MNTPRPKPRIAFPMQPRCTFVRRHRPLASPRKRIRLARRAPDGPLFPSLDFPGRESLVPAEAARLLGCSLSHVYNLILEGHLHALDISRPGPPDRRRFYRIPIESWRNFLNDRST